MVCKTPQDHFRGGVDEGVIGWALGSRDVMLLFRQNDRQVVTFANLTRVRSSELIL